MDLSEALKFAAECKKCGNISTSAKAVIVLAEEVKRLQQDTGSNLESPTNIIEVRDGNKT